MADTGQILTRQYIILVSLHCLAPLKANQTLLKIMLTVFLITGFFVYCTVLYLYFVLVNMYLNTTERNWNHRDLTVWDD